jgi:hypothetical protein
MERKKKEPTWLMFLIVPLGLYALWNCVVAFLLWKFGGYDVFLPGRVIGGTVAGLMGFGLAKILETRSGSAPPRSA